MLTHLIRKEFLGSLLNQRFVALAIFSIVLMPLSAVINYKYYEVRKTSFDSQLAEVEEGREAAMRAYRSPVILSAMARGIEPFMPIYYQFSSASSGRTSDATVPGNIEAQEFSTLSIFGTFDFLFLVQIVFSLLAVLLAFDMIAGEKERGTLKALLSNSVPRDSILIGKFIGGFAILWLTFVIGFLLLFLVLSVLDAQFLSGENLLRVLFIFSFSTLFLAVFFSLGLMVSTFCHTTRTAIVALLVMWVIMQLVIPKAGEMIAAVMVPIRSEHEVRVQRQHIIAEELQAMEEQAGALYLQMSGQASLQGAFELMRSGAPWVGKFQGQYQDLFRKYKQRQNDRLREIKQAWEREKDAQQKLGRSIALLSPASALTFIIADAAGTGDLAYMNYKVAIAEQYQIVDREYFSKSESNGFRIRAGGSMMAGGFPGSGDNNPSIETIPAFSISEPALDSVFQTNIWAIGTLLFYLVVPFLIGYVRFLKYDVR